MHDLLHAKRWDKALTKYFGTITYKIDRGYEIDESEVEKIVVFYKQMVVSVI